MKSAKIVTHAGLSIDLSTVKCFNLSPFSSVQKKNTMIVEFKTRYNYIENPETENFEKQEYNEKTEVEFPNYEMAQAYRDEWIDIWQNYLDEQS